MQFFWVHSCEKKSWGQNTIPYWTRAELHSVFLEHSMLSSILSQEESTPSVYTLIAAILQEGESNPLYLVSIEAQSTKLYSNEIDQGVNNQYWTPTVCRELGQKNNIDILTYKGINVDTEIQLKFHRSERSLHDLRQIFTVLLQLNPEFPRHACLIVIISLILEMTAL